MAEVRKRHHGVAADPQHVLEHDPRPARRLQGLRQDDVVERIVGIVGKIGVGVALDHRQALGDAFVDALARQLDAAAVDAALLAEDAQQFAVAAADVQHACEPGATMSATSSRSTRAPPAPARRQPW